jgi:hypothetical protein
LAETNSCPTCKRPAQSLMRRNVNAAANLEVVQLDVVDNRQRGYLATTAELQEDADRREVCTECGVVLFHLNSICISALCQCFIFSHIVLSSSRTGVDDDDPLSLLCDSCDRTFHACCLPESDQAAGRRIARRTNAGEQTPDWFCPVCATVHGVAVLPPSSASSVASSSSFYASPSSVWDAEVDEEEDEEETEEEFARAFARAAAASLVPPPVRLAVQQPHPPVQPPHPPVQRLPVSGYHRFTTEEKNKLAVAVRAQLRDQRGEHPQWDKVACTQHAHTHMHAHMHAHSRMHTHIHM